RQFGETARVDHQLGPVGFQDQAGMLVLRQLHGPNSLIAPGGRRTPTRGRLLAVLGPYRRVLTEPGGLQFSTAGVLARLPISMVPISIVLMVTAFYDSYALA